MATKILLSKRNSAWGIIINPNSDNEYKHVISFENIADRDTFINNELFEGENYRTLLADRDDVSITKITSIIGTMSVNIADYPNESIDSLLEKDFCVIENDGKYYFYAVNGTRVNAVLIQYELELDVFITYPLGATLTFRGQNLIKRAHTDRYLVEATGTKYLTANNLLPEKSDETSGVEPTIRNQKEQITFNFQGATLSENKILNNIKWVIGYEARPEAGLVSTKFSKGNENGLDIEQFNELPYRIFIFPMIVFNNTGITDLEITTIDNDPNSDKFEEEVDFGGRSYNLFRHDPNTLSLHELNKPPFPISGDKVWFDFSLENNRLQITAKDSSKLLYSSNKNCFYIESIDEDDNNIISESISIIPKPEYTAPTDSKNKKNEVKLNFSPFKKLELHSRKGELAEFSIQFLIGDKTFHQYGWQPDTFIDLITFDEFGSLNKLEKYGHIIVDIQELPTETDAYQQYLNENRITSKTSMFSIVPGKGHTARQDRADKKNAPKEANTVSTSFQLDIINLDNFVYAIINELEPTQELLIFDFFHREGYRLEHNSNLSNFIRTRFIFNYIEAIDVFNTIENDLSAEIKQVINTAFRNGITIWNYRDDESWDGIMNYEKENTEMINYNFINVSKKT